MPYDLFARNDRLVEAQKEKERAQQAEREKGKRGKVYSHGERIRRADWQEGAYSIRAAKSTQELVDEGHALHHCVGGYTQNVLAGRVIFLSAAPTSRTYRFYAQSGHKKRADHSAFGQRQLPSAGGCKGMGGKMA